MNLAPMMPTTHPRMTLEDYLNYESGTDRNYELVDGVLVEMGAENDINVEIESLLISVLLQFLPFYLFRQGTEIEVPSAYAKTRYPDLMVLTPETRNAMKGDQRSIVLREMPAPALVVEVVSPGDEESENYKRDYKYKPREYAARHIPEYWIIDPVRKVILVGILNGQTYQFQPCRGNQPIVSPTFPHLNLTAQEVLTAGR